MIAFGPVPSRRLGLSLGINNIVSHKVCPYSCVYCQIGQTPKKIITPSTFYNPKILVDSVKKHLKSLDKTHTPSFLTFVSNGEPTLDINLGKEIKMLKDIGIPIAVITNASLLYKKDVQERLLEADWISLKVDTVNVHTWNKVNKPHNNLKLDKIIEGIQTFSKIYSGRLHTETMLIERYNDSSEQIKETGAFIAELNPEIAYLSIPTRPPANNTIKPTNEKNLVQAWKIFESQNLKTEILNGFEGTDTGFTGNATDDILNITAVHPLREDSLHELIKREKAEWEIVDSLIFMGLIKKTSYNGHNYYLRNYHF